jgi:hypothetical protein
LKIKKGNLLFFHALLPSFLFIPSSHSKALFYAFYKDSSIAYIKTVS